MQMRMRLVICTSAVAVVLVGALEAAAQNTSSAVTVAEIQRSPSLDLSRWTSPVASDQVPAARWESPQSLARFSGQTTASSGKRTPMRIFLGAAVGATAGLFAGGYIGAWIEGDSCNCDDPGLMGALIGAPIGTVAGGILGGFFLF